MTRYANQLRFHLFQLNSEPAVKVEEPGQKNNSNNFFMELFLQNEICLFENPIFLHSKKFYTHCSFFFVFSVSGRQPLDGGPFQMIENDSVAMSHRLLPLFRIVAMDHAKFGCQVFTPDLIPTRNWIQSIVRANKMNAPSKHFDLHSSDIHGVEFK